MTKGQTRYEHLTRVKGTEMVAPGGWGKGSEGFMGTDLQVWEDENVPDTVLTAAQPRECRRTRGFTMLKMDVSCYPYSITIKKEKKKEETNLFGNCSEDECP